MDILHVSQTISKTTNGMSVQPRWNGVLDLRIYTIGYYIIDKQPKNYVTSMDSNNNRKSSLLSALACIIRPAQSWDACDCEIGEAS